MNTSKRGDKKMRSFDNKKKLECALYLNFLAFILCLFRFDTKTPLGFIIIGITVLTTAYCLNELDFNKKYED